jgi:hypothetical protein
MAASFVLPSYFAHSQFDEAMGLSHDLHCRSMLQDAKHHQESISFDIGTFARHQELRLAEHRAEMDLAVNIARRDSFRDAVRHTSQTAYSVITVDALMLNALFNIVSQLDISQETDGATKEPELVLLVVSMALGFFFLVMSIVSGIRLQKKAASYDISNPILRYVSCGLVHDSYQSYYKCHCARLEFWSIKLFLIGSSFTVVTLAVFGYVRYALSPLAQQGVAIIFISLCALTAMILLFGDRLVVSTVRMREANGRAG